MKNLKERGWIEEGTPDSQSHASTWIFQKDIIQVGKKYALKNNTLPQAPQWLDYSVLVFNSDLVERRGLGHGALFLYRMLVGLSSAMMPSAMADWTGLNINQVNYALSKLRRLNLVQRTPLGWLATPLSSTALSHLVDDLGVRGLGDKRRHAFMLERQLFIGRIVYDARMRREGQKYVRAQQLFVRERQMTWVDDLLMDDLVQEALALGAIVISEDGFLVERRLE
jgi:hypothetical protein